VINAVHQLAVFPQRPGSQLIHEHGNPARCLLSRPKGALQADRPARFANFLLARSFSIRKGAYGCFTF
jgi:hypothetical protein